MLIWFLQCRKDSYVLDFNLEISFILDDFENIFILDEIEIVFFMFVLGLLIEFIDLEGSSVELGDCYDSEIFKYF